MPKILVVADEQKIAQMVGSYLDASGFVPILASSGTEALARFGSERPDCIILDINLPGKDGLEVAEAIRGSS